MKVVLATGNAGKVKELQQHLAEFGFDVHAQSEFNIPEALEDGLTFIENAIKKARHATELTGLPAIADDSGLEVDALGGAPGIYSARFAQRNGAGEGDPANIEYLLSQLQKPQTTQGRAARFRCALVFMRHAQDPAPLIAEGVWEGSIALTQQGGNGFGYDPIFFLKDQQCTAAELDASTKKALSHRGKALGLLTEILLQKNLLALKQELSP
jgi:XTP/dITP diphosphohydrolase